MYYALLEQNVNTFSTSSRENLSDVGGGQYVCCERCLLELLEFFQTDIPLFTIKLVQLMPLLVEQKN